MSSEVGGLRREEKARTEGTGRVRMEIYCWQGKTECLCKISDRIIESLEEFALLIETHAFDFM